MRTLEERFWSKVDDSGYCWIWTAYRCKLGYGRIRKSNIEGLILAHRLSWEIHNGEIDSDLCVLHKCDNPRCVNPDHLFLGTRTDNNKDRAAKGRTVNKPNKGELNIGSKLSNEAVLDIRNNKVARHTDLAKKYGVSDSLIRLVRQNKVWTHLL